MVEESIDEQEEQREASDEKGKKGMGKVLIIVVVLIMAVGGGGFFAYKKFFSHLAVKGVEADVHSNTNEIKEDKTMLVSFDPFLVNLSEQGRFLKMTLQLELIDMKYEETIKVKTPVIRDAVITLLSSKSSDSISTPEGKFQLKDELLMRANAAFGSDIFKNIYFTDFVMQ